MSSIDRNIRSAYTQKLSPSQIRVRFARAESNSISSQASEFWLKPRVVRLNIDQYTCSVTIFRCYKRVLGGVSSRWTQIREIVSWKNRWIFETDQFWRTLCASMMLKIVTLHVYYVFRANWGVRSRFAPSPWEEIAFDSARAEFWTRAISAKGVEAV